MTITQQPSALNLSGNLPDIVATAVVAPVSFELYKGSELILSEKYQPSAEQTIRIRLKDMISQLLEVEVPPFTDETFHQAKAYASFTAGIGTENIAFKVIKGGVDLPNPDASVFLAGNFLTWQPQEKKVKYHDPEWLTYYAHTSANVRVKAYFQGSTTQTITLATLPAGRVSSINMNYGHIRGKFAQQPLYFDVWTEASSVRKSFIQRYILDTSCEDYDDLFVFENTLGGIDNVRFTGQRTRMDSFDTESALFDENTNEYFSEADRSVEKNTGYFPNERQRIWALEFFASNQRYHLDDGVLKRILVAKPELSAERHRLADYVFVFQPSHQTRFMNLPRQDSLPENLNIIGPGDEVFFLAPRLNEFAGASDLANALFPIQLAFEDGWRKVAFNELVQAVTDAGGGPPIMTLAGLNDTAISNPQEDDGLFYNPATQKWHNKPFSFNPSDYLTQTTADGRYVTQATEQLSLPGNKGWTGRHHFSGALSLPQSAPVAPVSGETYIWFGNPGGGTTPPPAYGNLEDLQNVADLIDNGKYLYKSGGEWVGVDITFPDLSSYATQSWVNSQGFLKSPDLASYATQAWSNGRFVTQATEQLSLSGNKGWTGRHHFTGALAIPQAEPSNPVSGQSYIWFGNPGHDSTPPPAYGNLEDLQNVADVIADGKYLRKVGGQWVGVDITMPDLSSYAQIGTGAGQVRNNTQLDARYAAISHTHTIAQVTGLQSQLDGFAVRAADNNFTARNHFSGALSIPQAAPASPVAGQAYVWFGEPGSGSTPPPVYGNLEDLQNVADVIADGKYLYKSGGEWVGADITFPDLSSYALQSWVTAGFAPIVHTHSISQITGLQTQLDGKAALSHTHNASDINAGTLGIARIPTGTTSSTVAIGNDSRIVNGQTAYGWGNHALAGYAERASDNTFTEHNHFTGALSIPQAAPTDPHSGQAYVWFGTPGSGSGGGEPGTLAGLDDVELSSLANSQLIRYNSSTGKWVNFTASYAPASHTHPISQITGLQSALNGKEPTFSKNTGFNRPFGTTANTVAQGNDSRINNGQTAYGWGNHGSVGYFSNSYFVGQNSQTVESLDEALPLGGYLSGYGSTSWAGDGPSGRSYGGFIKFTRENDNSGVQFYYNNGHGGVDGRYWLRSKSGAGLTGWYELWHSGNLANGNTNQYIRGNGSLATFPTIGTGTLSLLTGTGLQGSASFGANQTGNTSFTVSAASGYAIPTNTQIGNWNAAYGWGDHNGHYMGVDVISGNATANQTIDLNDIPLGNYSIGLTASAPNSPLSTPRNLLRIAGSHSNTVTDLLFSTTDFAFRNSQSGIWRTVWHSSNLSKSEFVNTTGDQTDIAGSKTWTGSYHQWAPSASPAQISNTISIGLFSGNPFIRNQSSDGTFSIWRGHQTNGIQFVLNKGGLDGPQGTNSTNAPILFAGGNPLLGRSTVGALSLMAWNNNLILRPNGTSTAGQVIIATTGNASFSGKITCPVIEPSAIIVPSAAPSSPESGKRYIWFS